MSGTNAWGAIPRRADPFDVVVDKPLPPAFDPAQSALLIVDLQYLYASRDHGLGQLARVRGQIEGLRYRYDRIDAIVPTIRELAGACRRAGAQVIHVVTAVRRPDGRDRSPSLALWCVEGSREAAVLEALAPERGDIVVAKTSSSAFNSTTIDQILRNLQVQTLIGTGIVTNGCVELTLRDGVDRGYAGIVVEDGCGANSEAAHVDALRRLNTGRMRVVSSSDLLRELEAACAGPAMAGAASPGEVSA
ncbi:MAG: cysteine hydrolase [Planctomycetes bacterium]|nr:cysteine hydrolase [Planctomycetota bacterium]